MKKTKYDISNFPTIEKAKQAIKALDAYKFPLFSKKISPDEFSKLITNKIRDEFGILFYAMQPQKLTTMTLLLEKHDTYPVTFLNNYYTFKNIIY